MLRQAGSNAAKQGFSSAAQQAEPVLRQKSAYRRLKGVLNDYKKLSKFRLSALVALTASAGYAAGSGDSIDCVQLAWTSLGTLGAAACANTLNQLYEVFNDSRMTRTASRPLPAGRLSTRHAKVFALLTGAAGLWVLAEKVSSMALVG
jgi:protoheme IX farnesyltransferase